MAEIEALRARAMASIPLSARRHRLPLADDKEEGELSSSSDKVLVTTLSLPPPLPFFVSHNWPLSTVNHHFVVFTLAPFSLHFLINACHKFSFFLFPFFLNFNVLVFIWVAKYCIRCLDYYLKQTYRQVVC